MSNATTIKPELGRAAADLVQDGMFIGLGTGSTARHAMEAIGERIRREGIRVAGVATSYAAEIIARENGIPLVTLDDAPRLDLALDGADEVDGALNVIKGRGGAHTREKVVASSADRFIILVDESKLVEKLGMSAPVPVEVLPLAFRPVKDQLKGLGARPVLRMAERKDGPVVSDQGFWIVDAHFDGIDEPERMACRLSTIPGVLEHGLFVGMVTEVLVGRKSGQIDRIRRTVVSK